MNKKKKQLEVSLKIYSCDDLLTIFPFGKTKLRQLLKAGVLPVVKVGRDYLTSDHMIESWLTENAGREIFY